MTGIVLDERWIAVRARSGPHGQALLPRETPEGRACSTVFTTGSSPRGHRCADAELHGIVNDRFTWPL